MLCFLRHPNDHISVMSASQIPKNVRHVPRKFNIFRVLSDSHISKNVCHDHIRVMSDSQIPENVCHDHIRVISNSQIPKKCLS